MAGKGREHNSKSLQDLSTIGKTSYPVGLTPSTSPAPSPSLSPSCAATTPTTPFRVAASSSSGSSSAACSTSANSLGSGGGSGSKGRQPRLTRKNLAEQLRDYQLRRRTDWASAAFFSATGGADLRKRNSFGRNSFGSARGGGCRWLLLLLVLVLCGLGVVWMKYPKHWALLGLAFVAACLLIRSLGLRSSSGIPHRRSFGGLLPQ